MDRVNYNSFRSGLVAKFRTRTPFNKETEELVGCSCADFCEYIAARMSPQMTVDNLGKVWTIGYILTEEQAGSWRKRLHYLNFYPMFKQKAHVPSSQPLIPNDLMRRRLRAKRRHEKPTTTKTQSAPPAEIVRGGNEIVVGVAVAVVVHTDGPSAKRRRIQ